MNEHDESEMVAPPILSAPADAATARAARPFSFWIKRLLVCNPFYLVSAALLLFGMYRISVDRNLFAEEISQLAFNLTSLQCYEILLVGTAIFLAARRIWYDSTLLVALENLFVFVPFILLSQVALISTRAIWIVCLVTALVAIVRIGSLKRCFRELNLPKAALVLGFILLLVNIGLLATYRIVGETKMGWKPDSGRDFVINQLTWLVILPAALALANFLPHARETGSLEPQRRWLPAGFFSLWIAATGVHLYCLNYVYNFAFAIHMVAPAFWVLAWTVCRRAPDVFALKDRWLQFALTLAPLLVTFLAASQSGSRIFFALGLLNTFIYGVMCLRDRSHPFAWHLLFASVVLLVCGLPTEWIRLVTPALERAHYIAAGIGIYLLFYILMSRDPKIGMLGSILVATLVVVLFSKHDAALHWAAQSGFVFLLLHSLGWADLDHSGARAVRVIAAVLWVAETILWVRIGAAMWMPCIPGGIVLASYLVNQLLRGRWDSLIILPAASISAVLSGPGNFLLESLQSAPGGLLAIIGSFLLFALGTALALTKHHWHTNGRKIMT